MMIRRTAFTKNVLGFLAGASFLIGSVAGSQAFAQQVPESDRAIQMTINDWTGQEISTRIMGGVLEEMGYTVDYVQADYLAQFAGLESGDLTIAMEIWETTAKEALDKALATDDVADLGETGMEAKEEWWYPSYVKEKCPGLPDWKALNDCADLFAAPETSPNGRYLGGPVTWGGHDEERIESLGLNFQVIHAGTDAALLAEVQSAYQRKEPIIAWIYAPHWAPIQFDGEWVKFPEYEDACYEDPSWGENKDLAFDCGKPYGWIKKVGWAGGEKIWPAAYEAVRNFQMTNEDMGDMIGKVDVDGMPIQTVVDGWLADHEETWKKWVSAQN